MKTRYTWLTEEEFNKRYADSLDCSSVEGKTYKEVFEYHLWSEFWTAYAAGNMVDFHKRQVSYLYDYIEWLEKRLD